jgi:hypothetical protein
MSEKTLYLLTVDIDNVPYAVGIFKNRKQAMEYAIYRKFDLNEVRIYSLPYIKKDISD